MKVFIETKCEECEWNWCCKVFKWLKKTMGKIKEFDCEDLSAEIKEEK